MALAGPQIGGVSLIVHIMVILIFAFRKRLNKLMFSSRASQRGSHPFRRDAK